MYIYNVIVYLFIMIYIYILFNYSIIAHTLICIYIYMYVGTDISLHPINSGLTQLPNAWDGDGCHLNWKIIFNQLPSGYDQHRRGIDGPFIDGLPIKNGALSMAMLNNQRLPLPDFVACGSSICKRNNPFTLKQMPSGLRNKTASSTICFARGYRRMATAIDSRFADNPIWKITHRNR